MNKYVLGFAFSADGSEVILIKKNKPDWQKDKLNGVGGKSEKGENVYESMVREFKEETGVETKPAQWDLFSSLTGDNYEMWCFRIFTDDIIHCVTVEEELIYKLNYEEAITSEHILPSLKVLLPMARDENFYYAEIKHIGKD
jgi:8-oxo-dGTP diphosphatase